MRKPLMGTAGEQGGCGTTAGEQGGCGTAAAGKGCPSNHEGFIQEASLTPRCKMIRLHTAPCKHKGPEEPRCGGEKGRCTQGKVGAHAVSYNLPPLREEKEGKKIAL